MQYLRYQTTGTLPIGPFIKSTDGYTPLTGLTTGTVDIVGFAGTGHTSWAYTTDRESFTEVASGYYELGYSTVITQALGHGMICYSASSGLPSWNEITVLPQVVYDSLIKGTGTDVLPVDVQQVGGTGVTTQAAVNWSTFFDNAGVAVGKDIGDLTTMTSASLSTLTTANSLNIGAVAGATVAGVTAFQADVSGMSTFGTANQVDIGAIGGTAVTTQAAVNWSTWFDNGGVAVGKDIGDVSTFGTANNANVGAVAGATVVGATSLQADVSGLSVLTSASNVNIGAVAGATVVGATSLQADVSNMSTFGTANQVDVGAVAAATVTGINNFKADVSNMSTFGTANQVDIGAIGGTAVTTQAAVNWSTFFDNAGVAVGKDIGDITTMTSASLSTLSTANFDNMSTFGTANEVDIGAVKGGAITDINDFAASGYTIGTGSRPLGDLYTALAAFVLPNATWDGTTAVYHSSDGGTTIFKVAIATDDAVVTTV